MRPTSWHGTRPRCCSTAVADLLDRHPERADRSAADVLARLGDAQHRAGRPELAMATYAIAGERCRDDPRLLSVIALGHEDSYLATGIARRTSGDPSIELLERRVRRWGPPTRPPSRRRPSRGPTGSRGSGTEPVSSSPTSLRGTSTPTTRRRCRSSISVGSSPETPPAPGQQYGTEPGAATGEPRAPAAATHRD